MSVLHLQPGSVAVDPAEAFALDVLQGLSAGHKRLPSQYIYDEAGSELFRRIMDLDAYYPTSCEREILTSHSSPIVGAVGAGPLTIVELGAGDGRKTSILLDALTKGKVTYSYRPVDISESEVVALGEKMAKQRPEVDFQGIVGEYFTAIRWLSGATQQRKLVLFLGSNIGNFSGPQARVFMRTLWNALDPGDLVLVGFDLKKDIEVMLHAYNDSQGVTRDFNLNLLIRINRELGGNFNLRDFQHFGTYNVFSGAMESYLVSLARQDVYISALNKSFSFEPYEPIAVEYSFKFLESDIDRLAEETGFERVAHYGDSRGWFVDALWRVVKEGGGERRPPAEGP